MRGGYIQPNRSYNSDGTLFRGLSCRGGIGGNYDDYGEDYEVEIGANCNFSMEMFAFCCMRDEIMEALKTAAKDSVVTSMVLDKLDETKKFYEKDYAKRGKEIREQDAEYSKLHDEDKQREKNEALGEARNG